jgi:hypothetical protein
VEALTQWLKQPFNASQNATGWFLFTGLIVVGLTMWGVILHDIRGAV